MLTDALCRRILGIRIGRPARAVLNSEVCLEQAEKQKRARAEKGGDRRISRAMK